MKEILAYSPSVEFEKSREIFDISEVTALMPIGGRATRALEITKDEIPKHLIRLDNSRTVLETICMELQGAGFRKFVFCLGHHADQNKATLESEDWVQSDDVSYQFSEETVPLGVDGAILQAIHNLKLQGQGMVIPGDVMLNWEGLVEMNRNHAAHGADITMGVTSHLTERTTDVGKFITEDETNRLLWVYGRNEDNEGPKPGIRPLTSAAANTISMERFVELCTAFLRSNPGHQGTIGLRDQIIPWAVNNGGFEIHAYDVQGEILDLGTPSNIHYGQNNWANYVTQQS